VSTFRSRAKEHLPAVLLTLVSIVQALSLELLWSAVRERDSLYAGDFAAVVEWVQVTATFLGVLVIWVIYASQVMRFRWVPSILDSVFPFFAGVLEFTMIEVQGVEHLCWWFLALAAIYGLMTWVGQHTMRRARLDGENDEFFRRVGPATLRDFLPAIFAVGSLCAIGIVLGWTGHRGVGALVAVAYAWVLLGAQLVLSDVFWKRTMDLPAGDDPAAPDD
jgi:hypothetical protein